MCREQGVRTAGRCEKRAAAVSSEGSAGPSEAAAEVVTARALAEPGEPTPPTATHASHRTQPPTASHSSRQPFLRTVGALPPRQLVHRSYDPDAPDGSSMIPTGPPSLIGGSPSPLPTLPNLDRDAELSGQQRPYSHRVRLAAMQNWQRRPRQPGGVCRRGRDAPRADRVACGATPSTSHLKQGRAADGEL